MNDIAIVNLQGTQIPIVGQNDISIDDNGDIILVGATDRAQQDIIKILGTGRGDYLSLPNYGSLLSTMVGQRSGSLNTQNIINDFAYTIAYLSNLFPTAAMTQDEIISSIKSLDLKQDPGDPRSLALQANVVMASGITLTFVLKG